MKDDWMDVNQPEPQKVEKPKEETKKWVEWTAWKDKFHHGSEVVTNYFAGIKFWW